MKPGRPSRREAAKAHHTSARAPWPGCDAGLVTRVFTGSSAATVVPAVLSHRADPDADPAGGDVTAAESGAVCSTGRAVGQTVGVVQFIERTHGTGVDAEHAMGAEVFWKQRIGRDLSCGDDGGKPDTRAVFRREDGVVHAEMVLFTPKVPSPARKAAWRCEKNATGFFRSTSMLP